MGDARAARLARRRWDGCSAGWAEWLVILSGVILRVILWVNTILSVDVILSVQESKSVYRSLRIHVLPP